MSLSSVPRGIGAAACACVVVGLLLLMASGTAAARESTKGATGATGPTGPAGANGTNGTNGTNGATGPAGTFGKVAAPKQEMKGSWGADFNVSPGGSQQEVNAPITFQVPLNEKLNVAHTKYLNEKQVGEPGSVPGCNGSTNEPEAEPGFLCVYTGEQALPGCLESEWKNAEFRSISDPNGNRLEGTTNVSYAVLVVFRTKEFTEVPTILKAPANLCAGGSWSVTELK